MYSRKIEQYFGNERATKAVYGAILLFAYLISISHKAEVSASSIALGTFFAALAIVIAEVYAELIGKTISHKKKLYRKELRTITKDSFAIISVSIWPTVIFLISNVGLFSISTAFNLSFAFLLIVVFIFSYWSFSVRGTRKISAILLSSAVTLLGLAVIIAKYTLGH